MCYVVTGRKELLVAQIAACTNQENWFVPFEKSVQNLTAEQAAWNNVDGSNSIWSIVYHLTFWNERYLKRFKGEALTDAVEDNNETFNVSDVQITEENWNSEVNRLMHCLKNWQEAILHADEAKLDSRVVEENEYVWWQSISDIALHNAYHIGQIVDIRKRQGSWNQ